jgi:PadR family transcriptional regulator AphA
MSRDQMPAEHAILGFLALDAGAGHGYDLARHFGDGQPLAGVIRLEPGMIYHHLKKLTRAGWVTPVAQPEAVRLARQVYALTPAGREELARWLGEPVGHTREIRLDFLVKLYFARRLDPGRASRLLADQRARLQELERTLADRQGSVMTSPPEPGDDPAFGRLVLDLRLAQTRAAIAWLAGIEADVGGPIRSSS